MLEIEPLVCTDNEGTASYHFVAMINGERHESKGAYYVRVNTDGKATEFRQWWIEKFSQIYDYACTSVNFER